MTFAPQPALEARLALRAGLAAALLAAGTLLAAGAAARGATVSLRIEAEDFVLTPPMQLLEDPAASGGRAIAVPNGSGSGGAAEFTLDIPADGDYVILARALAPTGYDDSFYVEIDGGPRRLWDVRPAPVWTWDRVRDRGGEDPALFPLSAGRHLLRVLRREDGAGLDALVVTNDPGAIPGIARAADVSLAWAGTHVGFDLLACADRQLVAFYGADRALRVGSRPLEGGGWGGWTFKTLGTRIGWDSHNYVTLGVDRDGRIHVAGNMHDDPLVYFRSVRPMDVATLERVPAMVGRDEDSVTYPRFLEGPQGELIFTYRDGRSGSGANYYDVYDEATATWRRLLDEPLFSYDPGREMNAYPTDPVLRDGCYHMALVWRDTSDAATTHDLCYVRSRDLVHWETSGGGPLSLPITLAGAEVIDPVPVAGGILNGSTPVGFDTLGRVVVSYHKYDEDGNTQIYNARREGDGWRIYRASDWGYRWEIGGGGSLERKVTVGPVEAGPEGELLQRFHHWIEGSGVWVLDEATMRPIEVRPALSAVPAELRRSSSPDLNVHLLFARGAGDDPPGEWFLRWETLPRNGDQPPPTVPDPGSLRLYRLAGNSPDPLDSDADALPDPWELEWFGMLEETGWGDPDGDGRTTYEELLEGTDPTAADRAATPLVAGAGAPQGGGGGAPGLVERFAADGSPAASAFLDWEEYNALAGEARLAAGDLDGDGRDEIVIGLAAVEGREGIPGGWFRVLDDDLTPLASGRVMWGDYNRLNGETLPACGDLDGDGRDEIVIGLGRGSRGWLEVFRLEGGAGGGGEVVHVAWIHGGWKGYNRANGETRPACGDLDGDGLDEIVTGFGAGAAGWFGILDDAREGFAALGWGRVRWGGYNRRNGSSRPACGDLDGDGRDEIVAGLGEGSEGWVELFRLEGSEALPGSWLQAGWSGAVRPACGDLDGDGRDEIALGLGPGGGGRVEILDDAAGGYRHLDWRRLEGAGDGGGESAWPAVARLQR